MLNCIETKDFLDFLLSSIKDNGLKANLSDTTLDTLRLAYGRIKFSLNPGDWSEIVTFYLMIDFKEPLKIVQKRHDGSSVEKYYYELKDIHIKYNFMSSLSIEKGMKTVKMLTAIHALALDLERLFENQSLVYEVVVGPEPIPLTDKEKEIAKYLTYNQKSGLHLTDPTMCYKKVKELNKTLSILGLSKKGNKQDKIERLSKYLVSEKFPRIFTYMKMDKERYEFGLEAMSQHPLFKLVEENGVKGNA